MNGDIDEVVVLIGDFHHLLHHSVEWYAHHSSKSSDPMVNMYHIIAIFELLDFLERERHLSSSGLIAPDAVVMEAFKNLMVSENGDFSITVDKSLMHGAFHHVEVIRIEGVALNFLRHHDFPEPFELVRAVGHDDHFVIFLNEPCTFLPE